MPIDLAILHLFYENLINSFGFMVTKDRTLTLTLTLTALFHPEHGVVIANATDFDVRYKNPLLLGNLRHGMFQVQMKTTKKALKTYAQIQSTPVHSKPHSLAAPVPDLYPKHIAKASLTIERLGYPSPELVFILAKDSAYGLGLPSNLSKAAQLTLIFIR